MSRRIYRIAIALLAAAFAAGCSTTTRPVPVVDVPATSAAPVAGIGRWWTQFNDPQLTALIEESLAANLDLGIAVARIEEARANLRVARSYLFPSVDAYVGASRDKLSGASATTFVGPLTANRFSAGLQTSYEVDLSGRVAASVSAAQSTLLATRYSTEVVRTVLAAQVANSYFTLLALDAELQISRDTLVTRTDAVSLQRQRYDAGLISEFDLRLAEAERASVAASIPPLERVRAETEAALAALAGRSARAVFNPVIARGGPLEASTTPEVPAGLPSDMLARRPDIRQSEAQLAAASARVAEARAQYFPSLVLTGTYGSESSDLANLFSGPALVWSIAGRALQPIVSAGLISAQVDAAKARQQQVELDYVQTVQSAFRDAHNALVAHRSARESFIAQDERRTLFAKAFALAEARYRSGYVSYIDVLDTQRNLLEAERQRVLALRERQAALVDLYKAIGGGWSPEQFAATR
ncbi:MAG TPA: efflux transporter outer membrane subunit [Burkholderiaceae bacterium]|nr:efflux transporter outer membrane subunit [Burkholderiaceae bacterium]